MSKTQTATSPPREGETGGAHDFSMAWERQTTTIDIARSTALKTSTWLGNARRRLQTTPAGPYSRLQRGLGTHNKSCFPTVASLEGILRALRPNSAVFSPSLVG